MREHLLWFAVELAKRGETFAVATVVRREPPSSAHVGETALITAGGAFHGWLGGSCTQPTVLREALRAMGDGTPRLVALSPHPETDRRAGVAVFPMTCHSGGSVDIYIEPHLPAPRLLVFGVSPVARALAGLGKQMGYAVDAVDPDADRAAFPGADRVLTNLDASQPLPGTAAGAQRFAVVATMGQWDEAALETALALEPAWLGVVASRQRFGEIRQTLLARGVAAAALERVRSPAGLDIGAETPEEIALSVLAELVQARRAAAPARGEREPAPAPVPTEEIDPVCGMTVATAGAAHRAELGGRTWYFCCAGCRERFLNEPARYAGAREARGTTA